MTTIFSKIINGEISAHKIAENIEFFAFLDNNPLAKGHTLVIPKLENDYIFDLEDEMLGRLIIFAKKIACAIDATMDCKRVGVAVIGLEVPHTHIHLVPINNIGDLNFSNPRATLSEAEFSEIADKIRSAIK